MAATAVVAACTLACSSRDATRDATQVGSDANADANAEADTAATPDAPPDAIDAPGADGDSGAEPPPGSCVVERAPKTSACAEDCDARLLLPGGDAWCTVACGDSSTCAALGAGLTCSTEVGACMPTCSGDAECTSRGFARCDPGTGACDTI